MRAVLFDGGLRFVRNHPAPVQRSGEAHVRVLMAGICKTDIEITKGYMGFKGVLGHEFVGVVERVDREDADSLVGKRVVGEINCGCGSCAYCAGGLKTHCPERTVLGIRGRDGAMADYLALPVGNLLEVPANVPDEEAVFTEPLAAAFEILEQVHIRPTDKVLVMGDGKLGILAALALNLTGASVTLLGKHEQKLAIAKTQGVSTVLLRDLKKSRDFDVVVEATGSPAGLEAAMQLVKPRGTVVLKTTVEESKIVDLTPLVVDEMTFVGSRCGSFAPALRALSARRIDVRTLVSGIYPFEKADEAFGRAMQKGSLKVLLDFRG